MGGTEEAGASKAQMAAAGIPIAWRDTCAGLLIKLNEVSWKCQRCWLVAFERDAVLRSIGQRLCVVSFPALPSCMKECSYAIRKVCLHMCASKGEREPCEVKSFEL
jgi:hypothetical protein